MTSPRRLIAAAVCAAGLLLASRPVLAQGYTFDLIADTAAGEFFDFGLGVSINRAGTVAFGATFADGGAAILRGEGNGPVTTIADTRAGIPDLRVLGALFAVKVNDTGTVAFLGGYDPIIGEFTRVYTGAGEPAGPNLVADASGPFAFFQNASVNAHGTVGFLAELDTGERAVVVNTGDGAQTTPYRTGAGSPFTFIDNLSALTDEGTLAFTATTTDLFTDNAVYRGTTGGAAAVRIGGVGDVIGPDTIDTVGAPRINDAGTAVFRARLRESGGGPDVRTGLFAGSGVGGLVTVADTSGAFTGPSTKDFRHYAINGAGAVAFTGDLKAGGFGIFTGADPATSAVITGTDTLFGSRVIDLRGLDMNDAGQIVFRFELEDGRKGIARANPFVAIPEPGTLALAALPLAVAGIVRSRRRRH